MYLEFRGFISRLQVSSFSSHDDLDDCVTIQAAIKKALISLHESHQSYNENHFTPTDILIVQESKNVGIIHAHTALCKKFKKKPLMIIR